METGKFEGKPRKEMIFFPNNITNRNIKVLINKLMMRARPRTFVDSLSDFGRTIASSYFREDKIIIIPTKLE